MAVLLSLESSTTVCSAAIHEDGKTLAFTELHVPQTASSKLAVLIDDLLKLAGIRSDQLDGVAVSAGPGSYTGLRIGAATAKGICYSLDIPLLSVNTLELMASQVTAQVSPESLLCPMLDARRMEVYYLISDRDVVVLRPTATCVVDEGSFGEELEKGVITFFGNGAAKCKGVIRHPNARFIDNVIPGAGAMGDKVYKKWVEKQWEDISKFEPLYLKDFVAKKPKVVE